MQNFITNRIISIFLKRGLYPRSGGGGGGGELIIGCIFCLLVDGPLPGETYKRKFGLPLD